MLMDAASQRREASALNEQQLSLQCNATIMVTPGVPAAQFKCCPRPMQRPTWQLMLLQFASSLPHHHLHPPRAWIHRLPRHHHPRRAHPEQLFSLPPNSWLHLGLLVLLTQQRHYQQSPLLPPPHHLLTLRPRRRKPGSTMS